MLTGKNLVRLSFVIGTCILMLFLLVYNCGFDEPDDDDDNIGPPGDRDYHISIRISKPMIPADTQSESDVTVLISDMTTGQPVEDVYVTFTITHGDVNPSSGITNSLGEVYTTITAGYNPGKATFFVRAGGSIAEEDIYYSGEGITFELDPSPGILCGDGISSANIVARITVSGVPLQSQSVSFQASEGCLNDNPSAAPVSVNTNQEGIASVYLRARTVDMRQGGVSSIVTATWIPSGDFSGSPITMSTSVYMEPVKFVCFFEDLNGNTVDQVNRDAGQIVQAVALLRCDIESHGVPGVPILFTAEKGAFLNDGIFTESITIPTDPDGRASAELWSGICETGSGSTTVTAEISNAGDMRFCKQGSLSNTACLIDFVGTTGEIDPLCLDIAMDYTEQDCRDDPRRSFVSITAEVTNVLTGHAVSGVTVLFRMLSDGGLSATIEDCRPIPPPACNNTELYAVTSTGGIVTVYGYVCTYGTADLKIQGCVVDAPYGACDTVEATGIGLEGI